MNENGIVVLYWLISIWRRVCSDFGNNHLDSVSFIYKKEFYLDAYKVSTTLNYVENLLI